MKTTRHTMNIPRSSLLFIGLLAAGPLTAQEDMTSPGVKDVGLPWMYALRKRVTLAILTIKNPDGGVLDVHFTVSASGQVAGVHVEGPPRDARLAAAAVADLGAVAPPPDHRAHPIDVRVRIR